jgi:peptidoglycan lytic transglycosylase
MIVALTSGCVQGGWTMFSTRFAVSRGLRSVHISSACRTPVWLIASALVALGTADVSSAKPQRHASAAARVKLASPAPVNAALPVASAAPAAAVAPAKSASAKRKKAAAARKKHKKDDEKIETKRPGHVIDQAAAGEPAAPLPPALANTKQAIALIRQGKTKDAIALAASIDDPVAAKLVQWARLRHSESEAGFDRYADFINANPDWPSIRSMRRRAEARLWQERRDAETVRRFVGEKPASPIGRLALARIAMHEGDRAAAEGEVRAVWQSAALSAELETAILAAFPDLLTRADHLARMDKRIGAKDFGAAMRAAKRVGDDRVAIVKACSATMAKSDKSGSLLDAVPADARGDLGYVLCRVTWMLRNDTPGSNVKGRVVTPKNDLAAAAKLVLAGSPEDMRRQDTDEWWRARRMLARKLIDNGDPATAYQVARTAAPPANPYYEADVHFMAGWIALRFLNDPAAAREHFAEIDAGKIDPVTLSRAAYWRGRAAEASGDLDDMQAQYQSAARHGTTYYGQLARARLGFPDLAVSQPAPEPADESSELVRAATILYQIGEGNLALAFVTDLAAESSDPAVISAIGKLAGRYKDAQAMLLVGKTALGRGLPLDHYAFPDIGVPTYKPVGSPLDRCIVYSIVRTESGFDQADRSAAKAVGLMQVTPEAGRDTAKRFGVAYDWKRLQSDPAYNTQLGAGEISGLLKDYRGSLILTFAGYNAGRGRVQQWMAQHGDPRDPKVDAVDWVERIPFSETRNYVQRVMENLQVYRQRFGENTATVEANLHRAATIEQPAAPAEIEPRAVALAAEPPAAPAEIEPRAVSLTPELPADYVELAVSGGSAPLEVAGQYPVPPAERAETPKESPKIVERAPQSLEDAPQRVASVAQEPGEEAVAAAADPVPAAAPPPPTPSAQFASLGMPEPMKGHGTDGATVAARPEPCLGSETCIDEYLWSLYERTPKRDTVKQQEKVKVTVKKNGKTRTVTKTVVKLVDEDFAWKDPKAAQKAGMSLKDYVIGGMDRSFKQKLYHALRAMDEAGLEPGITSAFRDDYRQAIASGNKASTDSSYHGGSRRGGYGHGMAVDLVSVKGETRAQRMDSSEVLWKWIDAHEKEHGVGRPYLDRDPPHVGPLDGKEYADKRGGAKSKLARLDHNKHRGSAKSNARKRTKNVTIGSPIASSI